MIKQYETTFIVNAHLPSEEVDAFIDKVLKTIEEGGGNILSVDRWGKRRLAYEIAKKQYGYYVYTHYKADGSFVKDFERGLKLSDSILRYLTVIVPKVVLQQNEIMEKQKISDELEKKEELKETVDKVVTQDESGVSESTDKIDTESEVKPQVEDSDAEVTKIVDQDKEEETSETEDTTDQAS